MAPGIPVENTFPSLIVRLLRRCHFCSNEKVLNVTLSTDRFLVTMLGIRVRVNQRIRFLLNVFHFPLPARLQWVEPAGGGGGERKAEDVQRKMYTLIYPDPWNYCCFCCSWCYGNGTAHSKKCKQLFEY